MLQNCSLIPNCIGAHAIVIEFISAGHSRFMTLYQISNEKMVKKEHCDSIEICAWWGFYLIDLRFVLREELLKKHIHMLLKMV